MNFPPIVKSWLVLICIVITTGGGAGYTAFQAGASVTGSVIAGLITAASNVLLSLLASPKEYAAKMEEAGKTVAPWSKPPVNFP